MTGAMIGTSGFQYRHWRGVFYPEGLAQKKWLGFYAERFRTVELNVTFYRLPESETFRKWRAETPEGFKFALKGSRFITHVKRLESAEEPLKKFMDRSRALGDKLGPVLWQLPPLFKKDADRLARFLKALRRYGRRNVFEFRDESWLDDEVILMISESNACLCSADWPPFLDEVAATSDFIYIRRHGKGGRYDTKYSKQALGNDATRIRKALEEGLDAYVYFNNDAEGYAPVNALELTGMIGL